MRQNRFAVPRLSPGLILVFFAIAICTTPLYLTVRPAHAQIAVGTSAGSFLGFEVGASSAGLAGANTSVASGAASQFWNPALLGGMNRSQVSLMHATWLGNLQYEWVGYARPLGANKGVGSLSVAYFHMPSVSGVDEFDNPTGEFRVYDMAVTMGYARPIWKTVMIGANGKFIRQTLATVSGTGGAVDLGASATVEGVTLGASIQNLGPNISFGGGSYPLPQITRFGISREFLTSKLLLAADYTIPKTYYQDLRLGAEYRPHPMVAVRMGYRREGGTVGDPATGFAFGLGTHVGPVNLDYAMTPDNEFADVHRLSFGYTFGGSDQPEPEKAKPKKPTPVKPPAPKGPPVIVSAPAPKNAAPPPAVAKAEPKPEPKATPAPAPALAKAPEKAPEAASAPAQPAKPEPDRYEVVLGSYQTQFSAESELKALRILGFSLKDAEITSAPGGGYRLCLVRFNSRKPADELAASLVKLSFSPRVEVASRR